MPDESIETEAVVNSNQAENKRHEHFSKETTNETKVSKITNICRTYIIGEVFSTNSFIIFVTVLKFIA